MAQDTTDKRTYDNDAAEAAELRRQVARLERELRSTKSFLEKVTSSFEAKEALALAHAESSAQQKRYVDILLKGCPTIIFLTNAIGEIILTSDSLVKALGVPNADYLINNNVLVVFNDYLDNDNYSIFSTAVADAMASAHSKTADLNCHFNETDKTRAYSLEISPVSNLSEGFAEEAEEEQEACFLFVMVDLTEIVESKKRAEAANEAKSDFLATMSHEIRTPMNAIIGMGEMLSRTRLDETQKKYLYDITLSSKSLLGIINDILDFSKIEAGKLEVVNTKYDLTALLSNINAIFRVMLASKDLSLVFNLDEDIPQIVFSDETRLRQILSNLLSNAVKYTNEGTVTFLAKVGTKPETLSEVAQEAMQAATQDGSSPTWLSFTIKDTGIGIKKSDLAKLFAPFEQLDTRRNRSVVGTGLGLAITKKLCEIMGGALEVESTYNEGSTFTVHLPFRVEEPERSKTEPQEKEIPRFHAPQAKVLVVDDLDINLAVAEAMLEDFSIHPDLVLSGKEALRLTSEKKYDLILLDHMMPEMDGVDTVQLLRTTDNPNSNTPIIVFTANVVSGMREMFLNSGFDDFLAKPIDLGELSQILYKWLPGVEIEKENDHG